MSSRISREDEAVQLLTTILRKASRPLTTQEIEKEIQKRLVQCPDKTPAFLSRLRLKGIIKGELSMEKRAWIWWIDIEV